MFIPIKCTNCGKIISDDKTWETYKNCLEKFNNEKSIEELNAGLTDKRTAIDFALQEAGLFKMCCRVQMMANIDLTKII